MIARVRWWEVVAALGLFLVLFVAVCAPVNVGHHGARSTPCVTSMKETAVALMQYASDADDRLPASDWWVDAAQPYAKGAAAFRCPSVAAYGYAFDASLSARSLASTGSPGTTPMAYDSTKFIRNAADRLTSLPRPGRHANSEGTRLDTIGYVDGHAKMRMP